MMAIIYRPFHLYIAYTAHFIHDIRFVFHICYIAPFALYPLIYISLELFCLSFTVFDPHPHQMFLLFYAMCLDINAMCIYFCPLLFSFHVGFENWDCVGCKCYKRFFFCLFFLSFCFVLLVFCFFRSVLVFSSFAHGIRISFCTTSKSIEPSVNRWNVRLYFDLIFCFRLSSIYIKHTELFIEWGKQANQICS